MKRFLFTLMLAGLMGSCGEKLKEPPQNLIPENEMAQILADLAVIDAVKGTYPHIIEEREIDVMQYIYRKHNMDSLRFVQSDQYYASVPALYENIYKRVEELLESKKDSIDETIRLNNERDSLKLLEKKRPSDSINGPGRVRDSLP